MKKIHREIWPLDLHRCARGASCDRPLRVELPADHGGLDVNSIVDGYLDAWSLFTFIFVSKPFRYASQFSSNLISSAAVASHACMN
jgi:hypothetical protein